MDRLIRIILFILFLLLYKNSIKGQEKLSKLLYDGDFLFRSFYLSRDILTNRQYSESCPDPINVYLNPGTVPYTKCSEKRDEHRIRFRLNLLFSPNSYTEIYYGLEVGDIRFGVEKNFNGPESGGSGSGATNIETRELRFSIFDTNKATSLDIGIFPYSTPDGLVFASSGAGLKLRKRFLDLNSLLELVYFKLQDISFKDNDFNGFSDENYKDIEFITLNYKIFRFVDFIPHFYFTYKRDPILLDNSNNPKDTYQFYWIGLYFQYSKKNWNIYLNMINQQGYLLSETKIIQNEYFLKTYFSDLYLKLWTLNNVFPQNRKKYPKNAYSGFLEISYRITDFLKISLVGIGATGRAGFNNDGTLSKYNKYQYTSAGGSFQFSEIGIDASGGYSLLNIDNMSGIYSYGIRFQYQFIQGIFIEPEYYIYRTHKTPNIEYNQFYNRDHFKNPTSFYGNEVNFQIVYKPWVDFSIKLHFSYFNAGEAYKAINDIKNGDSLREYSIILLQRF